MGDREAPLVVLGMPVYNGGPALERAVEAVLAQTEPRFELLISDDGSDDGTQERCRRLAATDPRITFIEQQRNLGMTGNFRAVRDRATDSRYFAWTAQDDHLDPTFLARAIDALERHPDAIGFVPAMWFDVVGSGTRSLIVPPAGLAKPQPGPRARAVRRSGFHAIYGLYRRTPAVDAVQPHDVPAPDVAFSFAMALRGRFVLTSDPLITREVTGYDLVADHHGRPVAEKALGSSGHLYGDRSRTLVREMLRDLDEAPVGEATRIGLRVHVRWVWGVARWRRMRVRADTWRVRSALATGSRTAAIGPGLRLALLAPITTLRGGARALRPND